MNGTAARTATERKRAKGKDPRFLAPRIYALATVLRRATNLHTRREIGLPQESSRIMILLGEFQPLMLNELAELSALDRGQLSRGVTELVKQGLVSRERQGRHVVHQLTAEGEHYYGQLITAADARNEFLLEGIADAQRQQLFELLDLLVARANALHEREREATRQGDG